ncbi:MAG TPA: sigma-54-dependent Fis family transcriptional regulator, partial [Anaeromyxobacteraceae bacterium]|nr:sigma-54-dependent Fis family transcriptional regulator [Anaeromyxobacteraceae bacterium]
ARPAQDVDVLDAWRRLVVGDGGATFDPERVRRLVAESWRRCRAQDVDPGLARAPGMGDPVGVQSRPEEHRTLLEASEPVLAAARDFLSDAESMLLLTDERGFVVGVEGDPQTLKAAEEIRLAPGATWAELAAGTNAIGTALALGQAVQVHGAEHYCEGIQQWTCAASVVRDPCDGSVVGAIDVSGTSRTYSRQSLAFVVSAAAQIEARLKHLELAQRFRILDCCLPLLSAVHEGPVIVFDRRGFAIKANGRAAAALARRGEALNLGTSPRIDALNLERAPAAGALPPWLESARIEPILDRGERVGTAVLLGPAAGARPRSPRAGPPPPRSDAAFEAVLGPSPALRDAVARARLLAPARAPVLLLGETGVGKELFARGIHAAGANPGGPFVALNCAGLARDLLASELFGYGDGAFTGARRGGAAGKIEAAHGGTLFLDELGEMAVDLQGHLLRALEEGEIHRVGENQPRKVEFRLVSATNRELRDEVAAGRFRMDLYYRVAVTSIRIPPLRDRRQDVEPLAEHYLERFADQRGAGPRGLTPEARAALRAHSWPGNVRELRNVIESLGLTAAGDVIDWADLPEELRGAPRAGASRAAPAPAAGSLGDAEAETIRAAVTAEGGNLTRAAQRLGIAKSTLYAKIREHGLGDAIAAARAGR